MTLGSAGGPAIINYVAKTLVGVLDWKLGLQQAIAAPNMGSRNRETEIERGSRPGKGRRRAARPGPPGGGGRHGQRHAGHRAHAPGLAGGADPRREGVALGDQLGNPGADH